MRIWPGRLVIKGIMKAADARIVRESGADGVVVSNHGIRCGADIQKALCLGARFVFVGRPFLLPPHSAARRASRTPPIRCGRRWTALWRRWARTRLEEFGPQHLRRIR
jgi:hypothetical protein